MTTLGRATWVALSLSFALGAGVESASAQLGTIRGKVMTESGAPVEDLKVWVVDPTGKRSPHHTEVKDPNGKYKIERVPFGTYNMFACDSPGYAASEPKTVPVTKEDVPGIDFVLRDPPSRDGGLTGALQGPKGFIVGTQIEVVLKDAETGCELAHTTTREKDGKYAFSGLAAPRVYEVSSEYSKTNPFRVGVEPSTVEEANLTLDVGAYQTLLELEKTPGNNVVVVNVDGTVSVQQDVEGGEVRRLPLNVRDFSQLMFLAPGVSSLRGDGSSRAAEEFATGRPYDRTLGELTRSFPTDAATPIGLVGGENKDFEGIARIERTGTNSFHGSVRYALRNNALDAKNFFNLPDFATFRRHALSASVEGPIVKDRLFFSVAYEFDRNAEAPTFSPAITANLNQLNQQLVRLGFPPEDLRRFTTKGGEDSPVLGLDANLSSTQQLTVRYTFDRAMRQNDFPVERGGTAAVPSSARDISSRSHSVMLKYNGKFPHGIVSEAAYSYRHVFIGFDPKDPNQTSLLIPGIAVFGRSTDLSNGDGRGYTVHAFSESLNVKRGKHSWNLGGRFTLNDEVLKFAAFQHGRAVIPGLKAFTSSSPIADLFEIGTGGNQVTSRSSLLGLFVHDRFQALSKLTLSFGLLYGTQFPAFFLATQHTVQPRLGLEWRPAGGATLITMGYSISRPGLDQFPAQLELLMGGQGLRPSLPMPIRLVSSFEGGAAATSALSQFLSLGTVPTGPQLATVYDLGSRSPTFGTGSARLERQIKLFMIGVSYSYVRGTHLLTATNANLPPPVLIGGRSDFQNGAINPLFAQIYQFETAGSSVYHGANVRAGMKPKAGFQFDTWYRFSRPIDDVASGSFEATPENVLDRRAERAVSDLNPEHSFNLLGGWSRPVTKIRKNPLLSLISQPYVQGALNIQSGRRFNVLAGLDANHDGNPLTDRPLNVSRNTFLGPRFFQLDTSFGLEPRFSERFAIKLSIDAFNVLNHVNFRTINTVLGQADLSGLDPGIVFGRGAISSFDFRRPLAPSGFGLAADVFDPRRLQVGLKVSF